MMKPLAPSNAPPAEGTSANDVASPVSSAPEPPTHTQPPPTIPDHELLKKIGGGSYGEVWLARNALGRYRAVKIVHRHSFEHDRPFEREFAGIQKFEPVSRSHEGLVDLLQVGRHDAAGYFYYVMELADGEEMQNEECKMKNEVATSPAARKREQSILNSEFSVLNYRPKTLRSLLRPNPQPSTLNPQPTSRLPLDECIQLGLSLSSALAYLHGHGLVHRDIKPSNIIFVSGKPKLADVGLVTGLDEARSFVGTEGYIPPEGPGTPQADLYSLGIVLYVMSTGKSHEDFPEPLADLAAQPDHARWLEFNAVIHKACRAEVRERYQSAEEMHDELALLQRGESVQRKRRVERRLVLAKRLCVAVAALMLVGTLGWLLAKRLHVSTLPRVNPVARTEARTIAVLPFDNESPDPADEHVGQSLADELSGVLAKVRELRVLGRGSAGALKRAEDRRAAAQQARVGTMLVGFVRKSADNLRLTVQLLNASDDSLLWSEVYDRDMREIFGIQTDIAEKVAARLEITLSDNDRARLGIKPTKDLEAYQLYLEGRYFWNMRTAQGVERAIECFQQAIQKDTNFARAYAGLADCYGSWAGLSANRDGRRLARQNAERAVLLGPNVGEAHASLGFVLENTDHDLKGAGEEFERALELDPNSSTVRSWYGIHLARVGQYEAAIREARLAQELDPLSSLRSWVFCWVLTAARQYDAAIEQFENNVRLLPSQPARQRVGDCYFYTGRYEEGIAAFRQAALNSGQNPEQVAKRYDSLLQAYRKSGPRGYWERELEMALAGTWREGNNPMNLAAIYAWLGDKEQTLAWLEKGLNSGDIHHVNQTPVLDLVRSEPRYKAVLKKMGFPEPVWEK